MRFFTSVFLQRSGHVAALAGIGAASLVSLIAGAPTAAHAAPPSVIYVVNGRLDNRDYYDGGGTLANILPEAIGDSLSFNQTLVNPAGTSETSLAFNSLVVGNSGTFSAGFSSLIQRGWTASPQFFIFANSSEIHVDIYVLGGEGTPYQLDVLSSFSNNSINGGEGSYGAGANSTGQAYPGFSYDYKNSSGTYSETGVSGSAALTYDGNTYSRIGTNPFGGSSAFFGITGTPGNGGFTKMSAGASFTATTTNLGVSAASEAPEPGSLTLLMLAAIPAAGQVIRRYRRRRED